MFKDLTGRQFENWYVISKAKNRKDKVYWLCECKCGNIKEVQATSLINGKSKSCGKCSFVKIQNKSINKICAICDNEFQTIPYGHNRKFCFNCSPEKTYGATSITSIRKAIKKKLVEYKGGACEICNYSKCYRALEFHHKDKNQKDFSISKELNLGNFSMDLYYKEIDKCILVCSNCHAEIHDKENNN